VEIKQLRIKFDAWQGLLQSVNTATDPNFSVKHEGAWCGEWEGGRRPGYSAAHPLADSSLPAPQSHTRLNPHAVAPRSRSAAGRLPSPARVQSSEETWPRRRT
jgi:hypothetical protein